MYSAVQVKNLRRNMIGYYVSQRCSRLSNMGSSNVSSDTVCRVCIAEVSLSRPHLNLTH